MDHPILEDTEERMTKSVENFRHELVKIRNQSSCQFINA